MQLIVGYNGTLELSFIFLHSFSTYACDMDMLWHLGSDLCFALGTSSALLKHWPFPCDICDGSYTHLAGLGI